jgi:hypothetical protein
MLIIGGSAARSGLVGLRLVRIPVDVVGCLLDIKYSVDLGKSLLGNSTRQWKIQPKSRPCENPKAKATMGRVAIIGAGFAVRIMIKEILRTCPR